MSSEVRTRFAPSPTGRLHVGNVRIAVFNWLFARHHGGSLVLRLEDTDVERNVVGSEEGIYEDLLWLGLDWDEGPDRGGPAGPYRQSERVEFYRQTAYELLERGLAYRCFAPESDGVGGDKDDPALVECRQLTEKEERELLDAAAPFAIRFQIPELENVVIEDEIRGPISFPRKDIRDFIILRSDGRPTYNFAVVVDDLQMRISHVVRGAGHLSNTPKQALLFDALDAPRPIFAHLPTVLSHEGGKLSKRSGAAAVSELRDLGYHPDGVVNYLSLLGWSSADEEEFLDRDALVRGASLDRVGASDTVFDPEKLLWASGRHIAAMKEEALVRDLQRFIDQDRFPLTGSRQLAAIRAIRTRLSTLGEVNRHLALLYPEEGEVWEAERADVRQSAESGRLISTLRERLESMEEWSAEELRRVMKEVGQALDLRGPALYRPIRQAVIASPSGPDLGFVMEAVGREEVSRRLDAVL